MGTGPFAVPSLNALRQADYEIPLVVTRPTVNVKSRKQATVSPVRQWANEIGIEVFDPDSINDVDAVSRVASFHADLLFVCDYGQILKPAALATTRLGGINLHGSLLPAYRGAAPVQRSLLSGDRVTGVSVIHMTPKLDGGPILSTREIDILDSDTSASLEERLSIIGKDATMEAVNLLACWDGQSEIGVKQDPAAVTKAPRLSKAEGLIDWNADARSVDCHIRGMQPWPNAFVFFDLKSKTEPLRVAVKSAVVGEAVPSGVEPGTIQKDMGLKIAATDRWIELVRIQPAGKREMNATEFLRGHGSSLIGCR